METNFWRRDQQQFTIIATCLITNKTGCMVEEWAATSYLLTKRTAKHILLRQCMREAACMVGENKYSWIYIQGQEGIGQLVAPTTIVVSARDSGYIALYSMPADSNDMLQRHASVVRPSKCP